MKSILASLLLCFATGVCLAQSESVFERYFREATEAYNFAHRKQAVDLFKKALAENPNHAMANLMTGKAILQTIHKSEALPYFKKAYQVDQHVDEEILFLIGKSYHYNEQFDSARWYYEKYAALLERTLKYSNVQKREEVNRKIFECRNAKLFSANPRTVSIVNLGESVNSAWPDYAPTISADESMLIFTSRRPESNSNEQLAEDQEYYEEIMISKRIDGRWSKAVQVQELNSEYHDASVSLSPDGKRMFVYSDENGGDIYETVLLLNGQWSEPKRLNGFINSPYLESAVSLSSDGSRLYFVSDRLDGYGGTDIYVSQKNKRGEWGEAVNLGATINTPANEEDVFISQNGHLYFSSDGHAGMGDLDVYRSTLDVATGAWSEPLNLGYPINSVENDFYFVLSGDEKTAYLSSFREDSRGEQDIYRVDMTQWQPLTREALEKKEADVVHQEVLTAVPVVASTLVASGSATSMFTLVLKGTDGKLLDGVVECISKDGKSVEAKRVSTGSYSLSLFSGRYSLRASTPGYDPYASTLHVMAATGMAIADTVLLTARHTVRAPEAAPATSLFFSFFFESGSVVPRDLSQVRLIIQALKENPTYSVSITGHADNTGDAASNVELSRQRAQQVGKRLSAAGIAVERIQIVGIGSDQPVESNATPAGRSLNRRVTVEVRKR